MPIYEIGRDEEGYPIHRDYPSTGQMMKELPNTCGCDECYKMENQPQEFERAYEDSKGQKEDEDAPESHTERQARAVESDHQRYLNNKAE